MCKKFILGLLGHQNTWYTLCGTRLQHIQASFIIFKVQLFIGLSTTSCLELADGLLYDPTITLTSSSSSSSSWFTGDKVLAIQTLPCTELVQAAWALERKAMHQDVRLAALQWEVCYKAVKQANKGTSAQQ